VKTGLASVREIPNTRAGMYRDASPTVDERDRAVGAILIGEALIASCERARSIGDRDRHRPDAWRAIRDAHDEFPEIWRSLDRARHELARRGINVIGYDELRPTVQTRLATAGDSGDGMHVDPKALDDARRGVDLLKLAVPGADWAAIEHRTSGLVAAPLARRKHQRVALAAFAVPVTLALLAWISSRIPRADAEAAAAMRRSLAELAKQRELVDIASQRRAKIVELQRAVDDQCKPPEAHELARQLVLDGRVEDVRQFAVDYTARCGEDPVVANWARAPRPPAARRRR